MVTSAVKTRLQSTARSLETCPPLSERPEELAHASQAPLDLGGRGRIGDADVLARPEALARNGDHARLSQQPPGNVRSRLDSAAPEVAGDVGIGIERAFRLGAGDSRDPAQAGDNLVAQPDVVGAHLRYALLRPGERSHRRLLHDGGRIRGGLALQ